MKHAMCGGHWFCELSPNGQLTAAEVHEARDVDCPRCLRALESRASYLNGLDDALGHRSNT